MTADGAPRLARSPSPVRVFFGRAPGGAVRGPGPAAGVEAIEWLSRDRTRAAERRRSGGSTHPEFSRIRVRLCLVWQHVRRAVRASEKRVRFRIADEALGCAVELHRSSNPIGDVPEVAQGRREMPFFERCVQGLDLPRSHSIIRASRVARIVAGKGSDLVFQRV